MNEPCRIDDCELTHCRVCFHHMLGHASPAICDTCEGRYQDGELSATEIERYDDALRNT